MLPIFGTLQPLSAVKRAGVAALRSLGLASAGLFMGTSRVHEKADFMRHLFASGTLAVASIGAAFAATPASTPIMNVASATFSISGTPVAVTGSVTVVTSARTPASIEFLQYVPSTDGLPPGMASRHTVAGTQCNAGSGYTPLPTATVPGIGALTVPGSYLLAPTSLYARGDLVFVRVIDYDRNINPNVTETIDITIGAGAIDSEQLRLTESGPSTGEFIGYIQSSALAAQSNNCVLNIAGNQRLVATYVDESEGSVAISAAALVDPLGLVFDSSTGMPVNGAMITMINMATGQPAAVFGNDSVSIFPSTVPSGGTVRDSGGEVYALLPGRFQFPRVAPGSYRFVVAAPVGYAFPSIVPTEVLQALGRSTNLPPAALRADPSVPFVIVAGSRGETFQVVPGPALEIDMPLDPSAANGVQVTKSAGKTVVNIGEFVPYTVTLRNGSSSGIAGVRVGDRLPVGFRYEPGSVRIGTATMAEPGISSDGRSLEFSIGVLAGNGTATIRYVAGVGPGAPVGPAENTAQTLGGLNSNLARATVQVREDLNSKRAILMGRVTQVNSCDADEKDDKPLGLAGVRLLMQDGTAILTDSEGRWHADNIRPGTHVVQLDETTLPKGYELRTCEQNTRKSGRNFSQFVNVRGGTLWRADFRLQKIYVAPPVRCVNEQMTLDGKQVTLRLSSNTAIEALSAAIMLPGGTKVVAGSAKLDGQPVTVEGGEAYLVARLASQPANWSRTLSFDLDVLPVGNVQSALRVQPMGEPLRALPPLLLRNPPVEVSQCVPLTPLSGAAGEALATPVPAAPKAPAKLQLVEILPYNDIWIAAAAPGPEWLHPQASFVPALPVVKVAVKHDAGHSAELKVNGQAPSALLYDGVTLNPAGTIGLALWRGIPLRNGANVMEMTVRDASGKVVLQESRPIHYSVGPSSAVLDVKRSSLAADGRTPPVLAIRMLDSEGKPVRRGATGRVSVAAPHQMQTQAEAMQRDPLSGSFAGESQYEIGADGITHIVLSPTTQSGEVVVNFDFGGGKTQEVRVWLAPDVKRDWVVVGFAEGTLGYKSLKGNMENLSAVDADSGLFDKNRVALFAKGQIKGEYLLTLAYDSAKERGAAGARADLGVLKQAINPNQFYTLYGDTTQAQFDAPSIRKLYIKLEKAQFYAMFGDFDTGLAGSTLGAYSRTLNGFKTEYKGEQFSVSAFASMTAQSFRKDEIQGEGISGLYRLSSKDILINSDKVRIEVRNRLRPEIIVSTKLLSRYVDYQIDHALGTLFFREPIATRDAEFNPVFIVAEYEANSNADAKLTYGARGVMRIGENAEVGLTHINEGTVGREGRLTTADAKVKIGEKTTLKAEISTSQRMSDTLSVSGNAYIVEATHTNGTITASVYARGQSAGYGMGQQSGSEGGTTKVGASARVKLSDTLRVEGEAYRQQNEANDAQRDVAEVKAQWKLGAISTTAGVRLASETDGTGKDSSTRQATAGVAYEMMDKKLVLRASTEIDIGSRGESTTFPNRLVLGADYKLTEATSVFAQQEFTSGAGIRSSATRVGLRTEPWKGADASASIVGSSATDGMRIFANFGITQKWELNDRWSASVAADRGQSLRSPQASPFHDAQTLASGPLAGSSSGLTVTPSPNVTTHLVSGNYTALSGGIAYKDKLWSANAGLEWRGSGDDSKINMLLGAQRNLENGSAMAAGLQYSVVNAANASRKLDARLSYVHRPLNGKLVWLDRLEYVQETQASLGAQLLTRKLINNFNANYQLSRRTQIAVQYGAKFVQENIEGKSYSGFTDLMGVEARQDIGERFDIGLHASMLHSWRTGARSYQYGASVGFKLTDNSWVAVGYNQRGFTDTDFVGADYRVRGFYVAMRIKFDQDTFNLNDRSKAAPALTPAKP